MAITPLPTPPSRDDPTNFATRADAFLGALPTFATEANALAVDVNDDAVSSAASAATASAAAAAATAAANATKWVSGTTYTEGAVVWSPSNYLTYRRKTTGGGTTDPSSDSTNWAQAAGTGDVTQTGTQTLTNKTLTSPTITGGTVDGEQLGFRDVPRSNSEKTTSYTLAVDDVGKYVQVGSGGSITIPNNTFSTGDAISIFNNTTGNITITCTITTAYKAGTDADQSTVNLQTRGVATILFISGTICVISGNLA